MTAECPLKLRPLPSRGSRFSSASGSWSRASTGSPKPGISIQLELKAMDVLLCLVEQAGDVVPHHELLDAVWQTEFAADNTIATRIADLRRAFGDDAQTPPLHRDHPQARLPADCRGPAGDRGCRACGPDSRSAPDAGS